jgi:hypothetical protein
MDRLRFWRRVWNTTMMDRMVAWMMEQRDEARANYGLAPRRKRGSYGGVHLRRQRVAIVDWKAGEVTLQLQKRAPARAHRKNCRPAQDWEYEDDAFHHAFD